MFGLEYGTYGRDDRDSRRSSHKIAKTLRSEDNVGVVPGPSRRAEASRGWGLPSFSRGPDLFQVQQENDELKRQVEYLDGQLSVKSDEVQRIQIAADQIQVELQHKELFLGAQASDDEIAQLFQDLLLEIKIFASHYEADASEVEMPMQLPETYFKTTPCYDSRESLMAMLKQSRRLRKAFVRGFLALMLCERLIRTLPSDVGDGVLFIDAWLSKPAAKAFNDLELQLLPARISRQFNDWRALTARLLDDQHYATHANECVEDAVLRAVDACAPWFEVDAMKQKQLRDVCFQAVKFSALLRKQRALWSVRSPERRGNVLLFSPGEMEDYMEYEMPVEELLKCRVEIVMTPALFKRGTSRGDGFDAEICQTKATVLITRARE